MTRRHRFLSTVFLTTFFTSTLVTPFAQARVQSPEPPPEPADLDTSQEWTPEVRVIADGEIERMAILSVEPDEIVMEWETGTGCVFELAFYPDGDSMVVDGETARCNFETWIAGASEPIDPSLVTSVWESPSWWDVFSHLASGGATQETDGDRFEIPDAESYAEIEQASECGKAIAITAFSAIGCGASAGIAIGLTGASLGAFSGSFLLVVSACGLTAVAGIDALDKCERKPDFSEMGMEELLEFVETRELEQLRDYVDVEELYEQYAEVEELGYDFSEENDAGDLADMGAEFLEDFDVDLLR